MANNMILKMIRQESKDLKISQKRLCYGICDASYVTRCIDRDIEMDKLMLEALLQRLGISTRRYTFILRDTEYSCFELREKTRNYLWNGEIEQAEKCLEEYIKLQGKLKRAKHLHYQVTLLLRSYIMVQKQEPYEVQLRNVQEGLACTKVKLDEINFATNSYTEIELLFILRGAMILSQMGQTEKAFKLYEQLYHLQTTTPYTENEFAYIFAKVNYVMAEYYLLKKDYEKVIRITTHGIQVLAQENKILYMWEMMEMYLKAEVHVPNLEEPVENREVFENYVAMKSVVLEYYKNWNADTHLPMYYEYEIYNLKKMVAQRRRLLGETQESFSRKAYCDLTTIERLERGIYDTQTDIRYSLLNNLGLPIEKCFYMLIADNMQVRRDFFNYMVEQAKGNNDSAIKLLEKVKNKVDLSIVINRQAIALQEFADENSEDKEVLKKLQSGMKNILCETLPENYLISCDGGLLYGNEEAILRYIIRNYQRQKDLDSAIDLAVRVLNGYQIPNVVGDEFTGVYLGFSRILESMYANIGDFEQADILVAENLYRCVEHDLAGLLIFWLFDAFWNKEKQQKLFTKQDFNLLDTSILIATVQGYQKYRTYICRYKERIVTNLSKLQ